MTPAQHERASELFAAASELPTGERASWLAEACPDDDEVRAHVARLLRVDESGAAGALSTPALGAIAVGDALGAVAGEHDELPERIGDFRVVGRLGHGGMGVVYEAEQEQPRRRVAVKVLRPGLVLEGQLRRFEVEAEVLGWLSHPGIAHVYGAGTADTGRGPQPYIAMELVRGVPLTRHADEHGLDDRARLALVARVCDAVHHAHQKGVIHRDLKPGNVLVDDGGTPKALDFGVARIADADLRSATLETREGEIVGTLPYMSPEQVAGDPAAVDVRSDVHALGVIAFELLTGELPRDVGRTSLAEAARRIRDEEPTRLGALRRELRGDVETIVHTALERDRERRYASAAELARDIRRFLADEPIVARPASTAYQLRKFARRNRALVGGLVGVVASLAAGLVVSTRLYLESEDRGERLETALENETEAKDEIARQKRRVDAAYADLLETEDYYDEVFGAAMPYEDGAQVRVADVLDQLAGGLDRAFPDRPLARARLLARVGRTYRGLGVADAAIEHLSASLALYAASEEPNSMFLADLEYELGLALGNAVRWDDALEQHARALERLDDLGLDDAPLATEVRKARLAVLGASYRIDEALAELDALLERARALDESRTSGLHSDCLLACAQIHMLAGDLGAADDLAREALGVLESDLDHDEYGYLAGLRMVGTIAHYRGSTHEALELMTRYLDGVRALIGRDHMDVLLALQAVGTMRQRVGELDLALVALDEAVPMAARLLESPNETHGMLTHSRGYLRSKLDPGPDPVDEMLRGYEELRQSVPDEHPLLATARAELGIAHLDGGRGELAIEPLEDAIVRFRALGPQALSRVRTYLGYLSQAYEQEGRHADSLAAREEDLEITRRFEPADSLAVRRVRFRVAASLVDLGRLEEAGAIFDELAPTIVEMEESTDRASFQSDYGAYLVAIGERERGEDLVRNALAWLEAYGVHPWAEDRARRRLGL